MSFTQFETMEDASNAEVGTESSVVKNAAENASKIEKGTRTVTESMGDLEGLYNDL
jgi:hypothetical protein